MSVEATKTEETAPVVPKTEQPTETPVISETPAVAETTETPSTAPAVDATPAVETKKDEAVVEAVPASEGVLGYKAPGFLHQFHFSKNHFWFSDEPIAAEHLQNVREKLTSEHAAWARETGQGALFYSKRSEDKGTPSGMILLGGASDITKEGFDHFSFKIGNVIHKFEAAGAKERDSWVVAIEKGIETAKGVKEEITGRDTYKKSLANDIKRDTAEAKPGVAVKKARSKSKEPEKPQNKDTVTGTSTAPVETKPEETATPAPVEEKKTKTEKERSQSRKRSSIFGSLLNKKEEQKTEEKKEEKAEKKAEKQAVKEEKKVEAEHKKEEAKATHETSKATEAAEAAAVAAVPAAVIPTDKKEDKEEEKTGAVTPTEKKNKRGSVFGNFFAKKNVTSPTTEKTEAETTAPVADAEVPPVSETAPKIDEPIDTKPLDAAAVTAPVTAAAEPTTHDTAKDTTTSPVTATTPQTEKKSNFFTGLIKKVEGKKEETKEEKATEPTETAPTAAETVDGTSEAKEERPAHEKRRTSLFGGLGTLKKKPENKEETKPEEVNGTNATTEPKREKSPLPSKIGGLFRKPSKATKSEPAKETTTEPTTHDAVTEPTTANATNETAAPAVGEPKPTTLESSESNIIGDVVPEAVHAPIQPTPEVKASA